MVPEEDDPVVLPVHTLRDYLVPQGGFRQYRAGLWQLAALVASVVAGVGVAIPLLLPWWHGEQHRVPKLLALVPAMAAILVYRITRPRPEVIARWDAEDEAE